MISGESDVFFFFFFFLGVGWGAVEKSLLSMTAYHLDARKRPFRGENANGEKKHSCPWKNSNRKLLVVGNTQQMVYKDQWH